ncbi:MAG TPA: amidase family protein [Rhodopila sp.]|nr:amidase family protein [Rhodopila sp.]
MTAPKRRRIAALLTLLASPAPVLAAPAPAHAPAPRFAPEEATIPALQQAFRDHRITCHALVQTYLDRIAAYNKAGPKLNAILTPNPNALSQADALDASFARHGATGPLFCVPLVLKDNYNTGDLPTTGGSASLAGMQPAKDAFVVARLRAAGAIILAKANMQEFALGGTTISSLGGQTLNPYDLTRTPGGSSGGTGSAVAANLAMAGTGTDTVNSVRSPSSANDLVGIRTTKGLLSLNGIMPVSSTQDAIGPIGRHVVDVATMLQVMQAADPADTATAGHNHPDYRAALQPNALKGKRIGVMRVLFGTRPEHQAVNQVMETALAAMKRQGAVLVELDVPALDSDKLNADNDVQEYEFKSVMDAYLASIPNPPRKTTADIVASGQFYHPALEKFLTASLSHQDGMAEPEYKQRLQRDAETRALLAKVMDENHLDAVVYPLQKRLVVPVGELNQADRNGILAAVTGYPAITVPAGFSQPTATAPIGVPVGMDILGRPFTEAKLLSIAYGFEQATHVRRPPQSAPKLPTEQ